MVIPGEKLKGLPKSVICSTGKSRQKEKMVTVVDEFDEEAIKRLIYNFRTTEKTAGLLRLL